MANRIRLYIDILEHINDLTFYVYRGEEEGVDETDTLVMKVSQPLSIKKRYMQYDEILTRDLQTPYLFYTHRHYNIDSVMPLVRLGNEEVKAHHLFLNPSEKEIEIHSGELNVFDGSTPYIDYEYLAIPLWDDLQEESGKEYFGTVPTGLRRPSLMNLVQDFIASKLKISYELDRSPKAYYYKIFAQDTIGNRSPWSEEKVEWIHQDVIYFRIERSADGEDWQEVQVTQLMEWMDDIFAIDTPLNVQNVRIIPEGSKIARIKFDNPWFYYKDYPRTSYQYRVRAEDDNGQYSDWLYFGPVDLFIEPKKIIIRRKVHNHSPSTKDGTDAITVFEIDKSQIDVNEPVIELVDDQLTELHTYAYTFFYEDIANKEADPIYEISDHLAWKNIIMFAGSKKKDKIYSNDFVSTFSLADRIIEIGTEEGE